jgi:hypothetical protein
MSSYKSTCTIRSSPAVSHWSCTISCAGVQNRIVWLMPSLTELGRRGGPVAERDEGYRSYIGSGVTLYRGFHLFTLQLCALKFRWYIFATIWTSDLCIQLPVPQEITIFLLLLLSRIDEGWHQNYRDPTICHPSYWDCFCFFEMSWSSVDEISHRLCQAFNHRDTNDLHPWVESLIRFPSENEIQAFRMQRAQHQ